MNGMIQRICVFQGGLWGHNTYGNLEIHHLFRESAHLVVETESVFPLLFGREDEIALSFFRALQYHLLVGPDHAVIDVERTA